MCDATPVQGPVTPATARGALATVPSGSVPRSGEAARSPAKCKSTDFASFVFHRPVTGDRPPRPRAARSRRVVLVSLLVPWPCSRRLATSDTRACRPAKAAAQVTVAVAPRPGSPPLRAPPAPPAAAPHTPAPHRRRPSATVAGRRTPSDHQGAAHRRLSPPRAKARPARPSRRSATGGAGRITRFNPPCPAVG